VHPFRRIAVAMAAAVAILALVATACSSGDTTSESSDTTASGEATSITVYSGRSEELVGPLFQQFTEATGITVNARYGDSAELAAQILEEGNNSPADVFFAQDAGSLGAVASAGAFSQLNQSQLDAVPPAYRSPDGDWVGVSGRARVVVYNTDRVSADELPGTLAGFTDPAWSGRVGWAPSNASFQAYVTALRLLSGDDAAEQWLTGMKANNTQTYEKNTAIVNAVASGEIDAGFVNHYYLYAYLNENPNAPVANAFATTTGADALVNVAGVGIVASTSKATAASAFVDFLLSDEAQTYFATQTNEYPLVTGIPQPEGLPPLAELDVPDLDLSQLDDLAATLEMLQNTGVL
jgi:iron(III) transport system substrate-binding protein